MHDGFDSDHIANAEDIKYASYTVLAVSYQRDLVCKVKVDHTTVNVKFSRRAARC